MIYYLKRLKRALAYAKHGWGSFDWDHAYIYEDLEFKLKRVYKELFKAPHLHLEENRSVLKSLRVSIKLLNRINNDDFMTHYRIISNIMDPLDIKLELADSHKMLLLEYYNLDQLAKQRQYDRLHLIMAKYSQTWWD